MSTLSVLLPATLVLATPILFAALGELASQRSGILNVGLEGFMLSAALAAAAVTATTGSAWLGVLAGLTAGALLALVTGILVIRLSANQIIVGLGINIVAAGLTAFIFASVYDSSLNVNGLGDIRVPFLADIPVVGDAVFNQVGLVYVAIALIPIMWWLLWRTHWGLEIRSAGDDPRAAIANGVPVERRRTEALLVAGALAGIGGAYLSIADVSAFNNGMSGGRGFIAIVAVIVGGWSVRGTVLACILFGLAETLQFRLPGMGYDLPTQLLIAFPYVVALVAVFVTGSTARGPAALMQPFDRRGPAFR